jgi:hypothetical protein
MTLTLKSPRDKATLNRAARVEMIKAEMMYLSM